ncbi:MAG: endopeptidase La, partial [Acholeplasmataceae bacterium]|nr:endopeptidase La [Acholeplasmataceae bacterium]
MTETRVLPALAVRGVVPIPNNDFRIEVGREMSIKALEEAEKNYGKFVVLMVQKNPLINEPTAEDIERYAVVARMTMKIKIPNDNYKVKFSIINRVEIVSFNEETNFFSVNYRDANVIYGEVDETLTLVKMVINEITKDPNVTNDGTHLLEKLETETPPEKLADIIAFNIKINEMD